jgi:hypothetical protein
MVKRLLELFCGTKSVGKVYEADGYEVVSLDYNAKFNATHTEDILLWDYKQYPSDYFDVIWASPDCTTWSVASGGKYRKINNIYGVGNERAEIGNRMVLRVIEMLKYFKCKAWFIENPRGMLIHYPPLKEFIKEVNGHNTLVYYGNYNNWGCPKATHIWSNLRLWDNEEIPFMSEDKYVVRRRNCDGRYKRYYHFFSKGNAEQRSTIPPDLIRRLKEQIITTSPSQSE